MMKRKYAGKGRAGAKRQRTYRVPNSVYVPKLAIKRTTFSSTWSFGTAVTNDFWRYYTFTAGDIGGFTDFSGIFDEYRIAAVKVTFRPAYDSVINFTGVGAISRFNASGSLVQLSDLGTELRTMDRV